MKKIHIILVFVAVLFASVFLYSGLYPSYLRAMTLEEKDALLEGLGLGSCEEMQKRFDKSSANILLQANSYDFGLCKEQNLEKAAELYETALSQNMSYLTPEIRLALIYRYGPVRLRNYKRAHHMFKQAAITLAGYNKIMNRGQRDNLVRQQLVSGPIPSVLKGEMDAIDQLMEQDLHTRKFQAQQFQEQGFLATHYIVHPIETLDD